MAKEKSDELLMAEALDKARKAFQEYFSKQGLDPAYFDYRFTAWILDLNFKQRLRKVELEGECK